MRSGPAKHLSDLLMFVEARVDDTSELLASSTKISAMHEIDPSSDDFPNNQVRLDAAEMARLATDLASSPQMATMSKTKHASEIECSKMSEPRFDVCFSSTDPMDPQITSTVLLCL